MRVGSLPPWYEHKEYVAPGENDHDINILIKSSFQSLQISSFLPSNPSSSWEGILNVCLFMAASVTEGLMTSILCLL